MDETILITGATGRVGSRVVAELLAAGTRPRVLVRDPGASRRVWPDAGPELEAAVGDFTDGPSLDRALRGIRRLYLSSADGPDKVDHEIAVIEAARRAGVDRVVKLSALHAAVGSAVPAFDWHGRIERHLADSGLPHLNLRPAFFAENLLMLAPEVAATGRLSAPVGGARVAMVAIADVAASAAAALLDPPDRSAFDLTGPAAVTFDQLAAALAAATGRPVEFADLTPEQAGARFAGAGLPEWLGRQLGGVFGLIRAGGFAATTDGVSLLTGRPATSVTDWAAAHAAAFTPAPAVAAG
ncbi:NAD(P)H-binding protein [Microlunatus speluncae]|uniref:NmrA family NAD(P)-binding protein n=1 Tax=Microlunatus speluncae TaxID=2594267 RepID=UPI0012662CD1|nr:NAD(P)H-binding protein [Microlunatus speluncae]